MYYYSFPNKVSIVLLHSLNAHPVWVSLYDMIVGRAVDV